MELELDKYPLVCCRFPCPNARDMTSTFCYRFPPDAKRCVALLAITRAIRSFLGYLRMLLYLGDSPGGAGDRRLGGLQLFDAGLPAPDHDRVESVRDAGGRGRENMETVKVIANTYRIESVSHQYMGGGGGGAPYVNARER